MLGFETLNGSEIHLYRHDDPSLPAATSNPDRRYRLGHLGRRRRCRPRSPEVRARLHQRLRGLGGASPASIPNGMTLDFRISRRRGVEVRGVPANVVGLPAATPSTRRARSTSERSRSKIGHVRVLHAEPRGGRSAFYIGKLGFYVESDHYVGRSLFMRCAEPYKAVTTTLFVSASDRQTRPQPCRVPGPRYSRGLRWWPPCQPVRLGDRDRSGHASDLVGVFLVHQMPGRRKHRVITPTRISSRRTGSLVQVETKPENFAEWAIDGGHEGSSRRQKTGTATKPAIAGQAAGGKP